MLKEQILPGIVNLNRDIALLCMKRDIKNRKRMLKFIILLMKGTVE